MRAIATWLGAIALGALGACAASRSDDNDGTHAEDAGSPTYLSDGGTPDDAQKDDASSGESRCSAAGWCVTDLPDSDLILRDIWPFSTRAFAVADSPTLGAKVLEWDDAVAAWKYIDDGTQNESGLGRYVGRMWAPSEDELYYTVAPGYVYHGTRSSSMSPWSWTRSPLGDRTNASPEDGFPTYGYAPVAPLGVWGPSADDVYAWFKDTIYHRRVVDGGEAEWIPEYAATDLDNPQQTLAFFEGAGTSSDDVWFGGGRVEESGGCAILVRRTSGTYRRITDGAFGGDIFKECKPRDSTDTMMIGGDQGMLNNLVAISPNELIGFKARREAVKISVEGNSYAFALAPVPDTAAPRGLYALSRAGDDVWMSGFGTIARADDVWDGGKYEISTIALSGALLESAFYRVRGTSNTNMWAVGDRYALHKTTP